jgi:cholesterol transport system auxiliary component
VTPTKAHLAPRLLAATLAAGLLLGCALTGKSEAIEPRYFTPERAGEPGPIARAEPHSDLRLRLGSVRSAPHLEERLVFRGADYELAYYPDRRWTEAPQRYLRRRLSRALFEEHGVKQVLGGPALVLDVELTAFEEARRGERVIARVEVTVTLHDERVALWEETLIAEQPVKGAVAGEGAAALVSALSEGLRAVVERISERTILELSARRPPEAVTPTPLVVE